MNKNIIIYSTIKLYNGNSAGSARVLNYARALAVNCRVYLFSFQESKNIKKKYVKEVENNIFIVGQKKEYKNKIFKKFVKPIHILLFILDVLNFSENKESTIFLLYPSTEVLLDYLSVFILNFLKRKKVFIELNEVRKFSSYFLQNISFLKHPYRYLKLKKLYIKYLFSEKLVKYFNGAICISTNIEKYFSKYNKNTIRIPILSNFSNVIQITEKTYNNNEFFKIGFFGSVNYHKENFEVLFKALKQIKQDNSNQKIIVDLYGKISSETREILPQKINQFNLDEVKYRGVLAQKDVIEKMKNYHLLILPRGRTLQNMYGFSTKLSEYLMSGIPTLVTNVSDNAIFIKDGFNGFIVEPDNAYELSNKLSLIINNYDKYKNRITKNAFETISKNFDYKLYSNILLKFLCNENYKYSS